MLLDLVDFADVHLTDRRLCRDVCAANHFGSSQRFPPRCLLPQGHQSRHLFTSQEDTFNAHMHLYSMYVKFKDLNSIKSLPCSAISISLRPNSAFKMSLTQKSEEPLEVFCCFSLGEDPSSELSLNASATNGTFVVKESARRKDSPLVVVVTGISH